MSYLCLSLLLACHSIIVYTYKIHCQYCYYEYYFHLFMHLCMITRPRNSQELTFKSEDMRGNICALNQIHCTTAS